MYNGIEFLSVFKIEEKPILRPCLSDSKREEIQRFKAKALEIERRLAEKNRNSIADSTYHTNVQDLLDHTDFQESVGAETLLGDIENSSVRSENQTDLDVDNFVTSISEWDISSIPGTDHENGRASLCSGATETIDYQENVDDTAGQSTIPSTVVPSTMIRSNSFIVDEPSECFLKALEDNGLVPSNSTSLTDVSSKNELNQTKIFVKPVDKRKPEVKKNFNSKLKKYPPKPFPFKKGRVPSDNISNLPEKLIRKCQNSNVNVVDVRKEKQEKSASKQTMPMNQNRKTVSSVESSFTQTEIHQDYRNETSSIDERIAEIVSNVEAKFHNEIVFFLEKQKREQEAFLRKLMAQVKVKQDAFQCALVMQIKALIGGGVTAFPNNHDNLSALHINSNLTNDVNGNLSLLETMANDAKIKAATKINAVVRGYLTRRLFKTENVQKIIKTIRDSLYLVIDLHFENNDVESVADIQMKHNLLQQSKMALQLESNRYNLTNIFVTKTKAEQMALIAFDRQMKIQRMVQINSKNNNKGPSNVNRPRSMSVEDKLKNLKIIELFPDSISSEDASPYHDA